MKDKKKSTHGNLKESVSHSTLHERASKFRKDNGDRCGGTNRLAVHHINNDAYDNSPKNVMTLCNSCHAKWHWEHGKIRSKDLKPRKTDGYYLRWGHTPPKLATE